MLNGTCDFTCKSLGVAVVVTEFKFEVSGEGSNSIENSNRTGRGNNQPYGVNSTMTLTRYDNDND